MKGTQAWTWLAAGVMALGLNGYYHDGGARWAHQIADYAAMQSTAVVTMSADRVGQLASEVRLLASPGEDRSCRVTTAMAHLQTRLARGQAGFARVEAISARQEAALARLEANRARIEAQMQRLRVMPAMVNPVSITVRCPRVHVNIPQIDIPQVRVNVPAVPALPVVVQGDPI
ncbi:MAG TPA: hypothetical protein VMU61_09835 [Candidatus Aquilonibacter sp.]|nr:hypothetical protein [Candidatus Aquilonibacter sp.]